MMRTVAHLRFALPGTALRPTLGGMFGLAVAMAVLFGPVAAPAAPVLDPGLPLDASAPDSLRDPRGAALARALVLSRSGDRRASVATNPDDARWFDGFALPIVDGRIMDFTEFRGELIAGGYFQQIGGQVASFIARWDGSEWHPLADGFDGPVRTLKVIGDRLYAGGYFAHAGSVAAEGIAGWDGTQWSALGTGGTGPAALHGSVNAIVEHLGGIAVAGDLTLGTDPVNVSLLGDPLHGQWTSLLSGLDGPVYDLAVFQGQLVAAGFFRLRGGISLPHVAMFDGVDWTSPGGGIGAAELSPAAVSVLSVAVDGQGLWAVGYFDQAGGRSVANVALWNGVAWSRPGELWGFPRTLRVIGGALHAGGSMWADSLGSGPIAGVRRWTGSEWVYPPRNAREPVRALGGFHDSLVVSAPGELQLEEAQILQDRVWSPLRPPWNDRDRGLAGPNHNEGVYALLQRGDSLFVGGDFVAAGSGAGFFPVSGLAQGTFDPVWRPAPLAGDFRGRVNALCEYDGAVIAGGRFDGSVYPSGTPFSNIARWASGSWSALSGGVDGEVFALAVFQGLLYAGGSFTNADGIPVRGIARWNGTYWASLGPAAASAAPPAVVYTLFPEGDTLWIGGAFTRLGDVPMSNVARWDGAHYHELGYGVRTDLQSGFVSAIARSDGGLVVGGMFDRAGGVEAHQLATWSGGDWAPFGSQHWLGSVMDLKVVKGTLWGGGRFYEQGATSPYGLASWNGASWDGAGSGLNGIVQTIAPVGDALYAAGQFTIAGGKSSFGIACWNPPTRRAPGGTAAVIETAPNPMAGSAMLSFTLPRAGRFELTIHDLNGRQVFTMSDPSATAGDHQVSWNGRGADGGLVPTGLYFVRVRASGIVSARGRIAIVR